MNEPQYAPPSKPANARKRRRQLAAWSRCSWLAEHGAHDIGGLTRLSMGYTPMGWPAKRCATCGCPREEVTP